MTLLLKLKMKWNQQIFLNFFLSCFKSNINIYFFITNTYNVLLFHDLKTFSVDAACSFGQSTCPPGATGLGGCYGIGYKCSDGMICSISQTACPKGNTGLGGCYGIG